MTDKSNKNLLEYVPKSDIDDQHLEIISPLFTALYLANKNGINIDHSSDDPNIMTLDLDQVRDQMREYRHKLITNMEILDTLYYLHYPRLLPRSINLSRTGNKGHRIDPIQLDYSKELTVEKDAKDWKAKAFALHEQLELDQIKARNLRAVIMELAEVLYAADTNARISITSSQLLELFHSNENKVDTPF